MADAVNTKRPLSKAAREYALRNASPTNLLNLEKSEAVYEAILNRETVEAAPLREAVTGLAGLQKTGLVPQLLQLIEDRDNKNQVNALPTLGQFFDRAVQGQSNIDSKDSTSTTESKGFFTRDPIGFDGS